MFDLEEKALIFATAAHGAVGQTRKYTNEPYIRHPVEVASIVRSVPHDDGMIAAALLHDVIEDTEVDLMTIFNIFGPDVTQLVEDLTDFTTPEKDGNRAARQLITQQKLYTASGRAQTIKIADLIHNTASIVEHDPKFAVVYLREKVALLECLKYADRTLHARALAQIRTLSKRVSERA